MKFLGIDFDYYFENYPDKQGFFGRYGGTDGDIRKEILDEMANAYPAMLASEEFNTMYERMKRWRMGAATPLQLLSAFSDENVKIYAKLPRKNNFGVTPCMGQAFLAKHMGKERIIASADDGVAAVMSCHGARIPCEVYVNPEISGRMFILKLKVMGGSVIETNGDPKEEVIKDLNANYRNTFLFKADANSPHPYPTIIRDFSKSIGEEAYTQFKEFESGLPTAVISYTGNGDSSVGFISGFTNIFTDIVAVNPGFDIPELMFLNGLERIRFAEVSSEEAAAAGKALLEKEKIKVAEKNACAFAYALKYAKKLEKGTIIVNL